MKNKKIIISIALCLGIICTCVGVFSQNKDEKETFSISILDVSTTHEEDIIPAETQIVEIEDQHTPTSNLVLGGSGTTTASTRNLNATELNKIKDMLIGHVNQERKTQAANKLVTEVSILETTGNIRAKEIVQLWSHTRPSGQPWETVLAANGITSSDLKAGEDLAKISFPVKSAYSDEYIDQLADKLHETLMNSPTHKKVILNQDYTEIGVGIYSEIKNGEVTVYVAEHFKNTDTKKVVTTLTVNGVPTTAVYTGKQIKPTITVYNGKTKLKENTDYTVTYGTNTSTGVATVKVAGKGLYSGSKTATFYIVPKTPASFKLTAATKGIKVSYGKSTGATGYEIAYSTSKTSGFKTVSLTGTSKSITGLTAKKTYYVKVRPYKTVDGKKHYGAYTAVKSVKTK